MSTKHKIPHSRIMAKIMKIKIFSILPLLCTGRIVPLQPVMGTLNMIFGLSIAMRVPTIGIIFFYTIT